LSGRYLIVDGYYLCDPCDLLLTPFDTFEEIELHHDHLLLDVVVAFELIID
jgi:hypothetical protein